MILLCAGSARRPSIDNVLERAQDGRRILSIFWKLRSQHEGVAFVPIV
jgi:hypothetical protein